MRTLTVAATDWLRQNVPAERWPKELVEAAHMATQSRTDCEVAHEGVSHERWLKTQRPRHTVRGGLDARLHGGYGVTHDMDCPGCQGVPFTASPRSETYWSS